MTKIIHCADLHLDSPMETHMTEEQASTRNTEIIHSFLRLTEYAAKNDVRAVILAGDMFDGERVKIRTIPQHLGADAAVHQVGNNGFGVSVRGWKRKRARLVRLCRRCLRESLPFCGSETAAQIFSPSPHLTPCYSLYYPKKKDHSYRWSV